MAILAALAYYTPDARALAHILSPWILVAIVVSKKKTVRRAMVHCTVGLLAAVVSFYVALGMVYAMRYSGFLLSYSLVGEWIVIALVAGGGFGYVFHRVGGEGWWGAVSTAIAWGLVVGDLARRAWRFDLDISLSTFVLLALAVLLAVALPAPTNRLRFLALLIPAFVIGWVVVSLPDAIEQLLATGSPLP